MGQTGHYRLILVLVFSAKMPNLPKIKGAIRFLIKFAIFRGMLLGLPLTGVYLPVIRSIDTWNFLHKRGI